MDNKIDKIQKVGNIISRFLLGDIPERIVRIETKVDYIEKDIGELKKDNKDIKNKVSEMFPRVETLWKKNFSLVHSPLELNPQYKDILLKSNLNEQIERRKQDIIDLIQQENPPTPLDAQRIIDNKAKEIIEWFDLTDYKNKLYEAGQPTGSEEIIFIIYLYEIIIPELKFPILN